MSALGPEQVEAVHHLATLIDRQFDDDEESSNESRRSNATRTCKVSASCRRRRRDTVKESRDEHMCATVEYLSGLANQCPDAALSFDKRRRWEQLWDPNTARAVLSKLPASSKSSAWPASHDKGDDANLHRSIAAQKPGRVAADARKDNSSCRKNVGRGLPRSASHALMCEVKNDVDECCVLGATSKRILDSHPGKMTKAVEQVTNSHSTTNKGEANAVTRSPLSITLRIIQEHPRRLDYPSLQAIRSSASKSLTEVILGSMTVDDDSEMCSFIESTGKDMAKRCRSLHRAIHFHRRPMQLIQAHGEEELPFATSSRRPLDEPLERQSARLRDVAAAQEVRSIFETTAAAEHVMLRECAAGNNSVQIVPQVRCDNTLEHNLCSHSISSSAAD